MKHVRIRLDAGGHEAEIHPMYDLLVNAPYVERATAMHWNYSGTELGIMHYVEGDCIAFRDDIETITEVTDYDLTPADSESFYAYIRDATTSPLRDLFDILDQSPVVVVPPVEYRSNGAVTYSVFGPAVAIQDAVESIPAPIDVSIDEIGSFDAIPGLVESRLSDRQREAIEAALDHGYYEIPREADYEDIARAIGCAPSTAAEHLQKAESKLLQSLNHA